MPTRLPSTGFVVALLVLITGLVVHAPGSTGAQSGKRPAAASLPKAVPAAGQGETGLPEPVVRMREAILEAVRSGRFDDLRTAIELNEMKPEIGDGAHGDQLAALLALSADGRGGDLLARIGLILEAPWVAVPLGRDLENNRVYIWPAYAETGTAGLTPEAAAGLALIAGPEAAAVMRASGRYDGWRLGIGADGTWHYLRK